MPYAVQPPLPVSNGMKMRHLPPGRTSRLSMRPSLNPFGFHQCTTCSGRVHASQTSATGASKTRVTNRFRSFFTADIPLFLSLEIAQVNAQSIEPFVPELAVSLEPIDRILERSRLEPAGAALGVAPTRDESCAFQDLQVLGDGGQADVERLGKLVDRHFSRGEAREDGAAGGVGQGSERGVEAVVLGHRVVNLQVT